MNQPDLTQFSKEDVKVVPAAIEAVVYNVEVKTAKEVYGDKANQPEQQIIVMSVQNDDFAIKMDHVMPFYEKEYLTDNSKMGKFLTKYGNLAVGNLVTLSKNDNGFYEIVLK